MPRLTAQSVQIGVHLRQSNHAHGKVIGGEIYELYVFFSFRTSPRPS
jgi:hypothetical protein